MFAKDGLARCLHGRGRRCCEQGHVLWTCGCEGPVLSGLLLGCRSLEQRLEEVWWLLSLEQRDGVLDCLRARWAGSRLTVWVN